MQLFPQLVYTGMILDTVTFALVTESPGIGLFTSLNQRQFPRVDLKSRIKLDGFQIIKKKKSVRTNV